MLTHAVRDAEWVLAGVHMTLNVIAIDIVDISDVFLAAMNTV